MERDYKDYLDDIKNEIDNIEAFVEKFTYDFFVQDKKTAYAVVRSFEIIGEATKKLGDDILDQCPEIPWKKVKSKRDQLIHHYFEVDLGLVWQTIQYDLPILKACIERLI